MIQIQGGICPHTIVTLPNSNGLQLLICYDNEGVYVNTYGKVRDAPLLVKMILTLLLACVLILSLCIQKFEVYFHIFLASL